MTNIQQAMTDLQQQIFDNDYYTDLYETSVNMNGMEIRGVSAGEYSDEVIINLCNDFWDALPDSDTIRRQPFFALCDIASTDALAEHCFDEEE